MSLQLENISLTVNGNRYIDTTDLTLQPGSFHVLLGHTRAGKTSLMRLMAGLDRPTAGRVMVDNTDVTGLPVQKRNLSMVYQQFINYPNLTVRENIASPLRLAKTSRTTIDKKVQEIAALLHIDKLLDHYPSALSGGQQQRTAIARALVKEADLILFDEPLVNLDYKLREQLRTELRELFKARNTIVVYATTEPLEALALGGTITLLHEGKVIQHGPTHDVYRRPVCVEAATLFSEPPINLINATVSDQSVQLENIASFSRDKYWHNIPSGEYLVGIRPHHITLTRHRADDIDISATLELAEISGSETYLHVTKAAVQLVLQLNGVHRYPTDSPVTVYLPRHQLFVFDQQRQLVKAPSRSET